MYTDQTITYRVFRTASGRRKYMTRAAQDVGVSPGHLANVLAGRTTGSQVLRRRIAAIHPELLDELRG